MYNKEEFWLIAKALSKNKITLEQRFWNMVEVRDLDDCWIWTGSKVGHGYGTFWFSPKHEKAHRVSWIFAYGDIPENMEVCHKCDNPACVNPNHLWLGTHKDNMNDRDDKGRTAHNSGDKNGSRMRIERRPRGEKHHFSKFTFSDILKIRELVKSGVQQIQLAKQYNVHPGTINKIVKNITWNEKAIETIRGNNAQA